MEDRQERACKLVELYLSKIFGSLRVYRENHKFLIPWGFSAINAFVYRREEEVFIGINAPVALRVPNNKELLQFLLAENNSLTGCAFSVEFEGDVLDILIGVKLRFEDITRDSLEFITLTVGNLANEYGREIIAVFGGITFKEYIEKESVKENTSGEKLLHATIFAGDRELLLEMYMVKDGSYSIICRPADEVDRILINARREGEPSAVFKLFENVKDSLEEGNIKLLKTMLTDYEINLDLICEVMSKHSRHANKLRDMKKVITELSDQFINGKISHREYKKRLSDIEKEFGLQ